MQNPTLLKTIASQSNPESLVYDPFSKCFVQIPSNLDSHLEASGLILNSDPQIQPFLKLVPLLNPEQVFQTMDNLELVNTSSKNVKFVSEHCFRTGVQFIELTNPFDFKNVKVSLMTTTPKGSVNEFPLKLENFRVGESLIVKIDLDVKVFSVIAHQTNKGKEVPLKGSGFKFVVELHTIGSFVSLNPCYLFKGQNDVWSLNLRLFDSKFLALVKDWVFVKNFDAEKFGGVEKFLTEKVGVSKAESPETFDCIFNETSRILAFKLPHEIVKVVKKSLKEVEIVPPSVLKNVLKSVYQNSKFETHLQFTDLIDFVSKSSKRFLERLPTQKLIDLVNEFKKQPVKKIEKTHSLNSNILKVDFLETADSLLLFNGFNKLKILKQKSKKREFVVSPFVFDTAHVNFYLSKEEFALLFGVFNWVDLIVKLHLTEHEINSLESIFHTLTQPNSLLTDGKYFFFNLSEQQVQILVEKAFEYLNLTIHSAYPFEAKEDDITIENNAEEKAETKPKSAENFAEEGLGDLFSETHEKAAHMDVDSHSLKTHLDSFFRNHFESFPGEFDGFLSVIFKMEEALHLQSAHYRQLNVFGNRAHTAFGRLFSYVGSTLPMGQIIKLIDFGIYINSAFLNQFKHYRHEKYFYNDFNDQNIAHLFLDSYTQMRSNPHVSGIPNDNIELDFSISHMPCFVSGGKIEQCFILQNGKFVGVVTESKELLLFSTTVGLSKVFQTNLRNSVTWTSPTKFDDIIQNTVADVKDLLEEESEAVKKPDAAQAQTPKTEEAEKVVDKAMLDNLYNMGFPLEISKKALMEVKSSSIDDAINQIFKMKEEKNKTQEPTKTRVFRLQLKPQWDCKVCTLLNTIDPNNATPDVCEVCGNAADQDAYFEEVEEEKILAPTVEPERIFKSDSNLEANDQILSVELVSLKKDNLFNKYFVLLTFRRQGKTFLMGSRLALSEAIIKKLAFQDPKSKGFAMSLGFGQLKKNACERELSVAYNTFFEEKVLSISAKLTDASLFVETSRKIFEIKMNDEFQFAHASDLSAINERGNEFKSVYLVGQKTVQIVLLTNKSRTYCSNDFDFMLSETVVLGNVLRLISLPSDLLLVLRSEGYSKVDKKLKNESDLVAIRPFERVLFSNDQEIVLLQTDSQIGVVETGESAARNNMQLLKKRILDFRKQNKSNENDDFVNPQTLLTYFKTQWNIPFKSKKFRNLFQSLCRTDAVYSISAQAIDPVLPSSFVIVPDFETEGCNVNLEVFLRIPRSNQSIQAFVTTTTVPAQKAQNSFFNFYQQLELRNVVFKGAALSKSHHVSQMLVQNGEYFSTKYPFNLFVFESVYEKIMKVKKVNFTMSDSFKQHNVVDEVLVFVFNDLMLLNQFVNFTHMSPLTLETGLRNGSFSPFSEPCLSLSLKKAINGCISEELEVARYGKYVAFLPTKREKGVPTGGKNLDCFQFFGVEGEYATDNEADLLTVSSNLGIKNTAVLHKFDNFTCRVRHGGKEETLKDFAVHIVQENKSEYQAKVSTTFSIFGKSLEGVELLFDAKPDESQLMGISARLSNISHSLIVKIREQLESGVSEKLVAIFKLYDQKIIEASCKNDTTMESHFHSLVDLLLFIIESFGAKSIDSILKLNFEHILQYCILTSKENKMIGASRFLIEKLFAFESSHKYFKAIFSGALAGLPQTDLTYEGLQTFWQLLGKLTGFVHAEIKSQILTEIVEHLSKCVAKTQQLNLPSNQILRTFGFPETVNQLTAFGSEGDDAKKEKTGKPSLSLQNKNPNKTDFLDNASLVDWNGFSYHEKNYAEYYINCTDVIKLDQILVRFPKIKPLLHTTIEVYAFNTQKEAFELVKSKQLSEDFINYLGSKETVADKNSLAHYDLGFNFANFDETVKLLKIVVRVNFIPVFEYTEADSTVYEFFIHGVPVDKILSQLTFTTAALKETNAALLVDIVKKSNACYTSLDDDLSSLSSAKNKVKDLSSKAIYPEGKKDESSVENKLVKAEAKGSELENGNGLVEAKGVADDLVALKETLEEHLTGIEVSELKNKTSLVSGIAVLIVQYKTAIESQKLKSGAKFDLQNNLTFWTTNLNLAIQEFAVIFADKGHPTALTPNKKTFSVIWQRVFFDSYFFDASHTAKATEEFLVDSLRVFDAKENKELLQKVVEEYLQFSDVVFVSNIDRLIDRLKAVKLQSYFSWLELIADIHRVSPAKVEDISQEQIRHLILNCSFLNAHSKEQLNCSQDVFSRLQQIVVWVLSNQLELVSKKFEETVLVLVSQIFKCLAPGQNSELEINVEAFKTILVLTAKNGMLPKIDKILADFVKLVTKTQLKSNESRKSRALLNSLKLILMSFISENILESDQDAVFGSEKISDILFFALTHIKSIDEIQNSLSVEKEEEPKTPAPVLAPKDCMLKKVQKVDRSNSLSHVHVEVDSVFSTFVSDILKFMTVRNLQDNALISIITNFAINEQINSTLLFGFIKFAMAQSKDTRQTIIHDLGLKFSDIHKKLKSHKNKNLARDFSSATIELLIELMRNYPESLHEDISLTHFAITITLHVINENEAKAIASEPCKQHLKPQLIAPLFYYTINILVGKFNFGGTDNFQNFLDHDINLFELLCNCMHIIIKGIDDSNSNLLNFFIQNFKNLRDSATDFDLNTALESLSIWSLCNYNATSPELKSVIGPMLKKLHSDINYLYAEFFKKEEAAKVILNFICVNFRRLNAVLSQRVEKQTMGFQAIYMSENSIEFFETTLKYISENEILANHFLIHNKGLEIIFEILHKNSTDTTFSVGDSLKKTSLLTQMKKIAQVSMDKSSTLDIAKSSFSPNKDKAIFEEEFGTKIVNVQIDKSINNGATVKDWHSNKTGKNSSIYNTGIPSNKKSISLRFKVTEEFELRTFRLALTVARSENYLVVGPSPYIQLYAIQEDEKKEVRRVYLGELSRINDSGYLMFNSIVYVLNVNKLEGRDYVSSIQHLRHIKELREFEVVIARPLFSVVDKISPLSNRTVTAINLSINFISIEGFSHNKIDIAAIFKNKVQVSFFKFLEIIFNSECFSRSIDDYFDGINREKKLGIYDLIETQLNPIMQNFEEKMSKFLMTLSEKNKKLADSIFLFLMKNIEKKATFYFLIERILKKTFSYKYLFEFFDYGKRKLLTDATSTSRFLMVIINYLTFLAQKLKLEKQPVQFILPIDEKFYKAVLNAHKNSPFNYQIERFLTVTVIFLLEGKLFTVFPQSMLKTDGYLVDSRQLTQNTKEFGTQLINLVIDRIQAQENIYLHLLAYISLKSPEAQKAILQHNIIEKISKQIKSKDAEFSMEVLLFIQSVAEVPALYELLTQNEIDKGLISLLEENLPKKKFRENLDLVNTALKTIFIIFKNSKDQITELEDVLFAMLKRHKDDSFFIEKVLLKFFEFEITKKVSFNFKKEDGSANSMVAPEDLTGVQTIAKQKPININSANMSAEHFSRLATQLTFLVDEKTEKTIKSFEWKKVLETSDSAEDFSDSFEAQMYNKKPSLTLMSLDNNGTVGYLGLFVPEGFVKFPDQTEAVAYIPNSDNTFLFWYSEETFVHYKPSLDKCDKFLKYYNTESNKSIVFTFDSAEKITISMIADYPSSVDLYQMKPIPQDNNPEFEFPYDCAINGIEIFQLDVKVDEKSEMTNESNNESLMGQYIDKLGTIDVHNSMYEEAIYYELPNQLTFKALKQVFSALILPAEIKDLSIGEIPADKIQLDIAKEMSYFTRVVYQSHYNPLFPVFEIFLTRGGIQYVIETIKNNENISFLKEKNFKEIWKQLMDDLLDLQKIDGFLSAMTQNKDFLLIIFELFIGSAKSGRNWEEAEFTISNLMFDKLASILKNSDSLSMRFMFFEKNVLRKLLDKMKTLSYENVRHFKEKEDKVEVLETEIPIEKDEPLLKEVKKRKGVGYEKEGSGKKWIVNEYLAKKKLRNEFIVNLLKLFKNLFALPFDEYKPEDPGTVAVKNSWYRTIAESCLLPMLEGAFKCSSLHEMSKEYEVYEQYCEILLTIASNSYLKPLLLQLPAEYKPVQLESMISILKKQEENTNLFKNFAQTDKLKPAENEDKLQSIELGNRVLEMIELIKLKYPEQFDDDNEEEYENITDKDVEGILRLPVNDMYKIAFRNLRFDLVDFKKTGESVTEHHYSSNIASDAKSSSQGRMVRLAQEIADLSSSLPIDSYNAITVRADVNRLDVIKAMIAGAENTPYANGLFEYHVYLPTEYPSSPPKCNLETTGSGDVRFNPNLYSCGKVCLSLLGTWRGSASENWDPKISNLLQLFLSIQSVVMSEEVYFNEPGYEGEAGTEEGEKKNEGYSNIVRLNNIKYAMIKQIKTPVVGFEEVTRRHFYIKRDVLLKECGKWVKYAEVRPCSYGGLISDHNHKYASKFSTNPKAYVAELKAAITELEKTLKELVLNCDPHTIFANKKLFVTKNKSKTKKKKVENAETKTAHEKIDTTWDDFTQFEKFDAEDKKVADRWSRYIGAMGIEAVKKQSTAKVAVVGLNGLGLEIAKNIVLSGVNTLTLVDWRKIEQGDLLGNFYASALDVGVNRATCVKSKIQQLNFYVKVEELDISEKEVLDFASHYSVVVITDNYLPKTAKIWELARQHKVKIILAENVGVYSRVFVDFGAEFVVNDRDGEDPSDCYIKSIDYDQNVITLFEKSFNQLRDGDYIVLSEVETSETDASLQDVNGSIHRIKNMRKVTEIEVEDLSKFKRYLRNGKIKELKVPLTHKFRNYAELTVANQEEFFEENLKLHDFMKLESIPLVSKCFLLKEKFERTQSKELRKATLEEFLQVADEEEKKDVNLRRKMIMFWVTARGGIHSLDAFIGGIVSQETIIGITGKYTPIKQLFCTDIEDILPDELRNNPENFTEERIGKILVTEGKYGRLGLLLGAELLKEVRNSKLFMVGAGAIGCELLKNCVMIGIGSGEKGSLTLTDPDSIELSNLNRQFLFREKHISKPKSFVAASVVLTMNEDYKDKISAKLEKVCDETEEVFDDEFIRSQSICLNALDNVKARVYMDQRCVKNHVPLLESGTLGPKGHVQVILPAQTENYSQVRDANEEHNIPVCTLKMFPEEPIHCMEWAKDRFEVLFGQNPTSLIRVLEEFQAKKDVGEVDMKIKKTVYKLLRQRPSSIKQAIEMARKFYQKSFVNKIKQLLVVYPLDYKTKEGKLFWTLPKRPPTVKEFSVDDPVDMKFIESYSKLLCRIWGVDETLPEKAELERILGEVHIEPFKAKDSQILKIKKDVEKMEKNKNQPEEAPVEKAPEYKMDEELKLNNELNELLSKLEIAAMLKTTKPEIFEKDVDSNSHVDLIHSVTSLRSQNYKLAEMDWMSVKLKAGRIVPALATTTATIAALQTIEAIKIIKKSKLDEFKNCFLNLAIPSMTLSEPGPAMKFKIHETLTVTVWDRWEFVFSEKKNDLFKNLVEFIESTYKLHVVDVLKDNKPIFLAAINERKVFEKVKLADLLELEAGDNCHVSVICKLTPESEKPIQNLPLVKVIFN